MLQKIWFLAFGLLLGMAQAALPIYEPFDYPPGTFIVGQTNSGGQVWRASQTQLSQPAVTLGNLSGGGWPVSVGGMLNGGWSGGFDGGARLPFGAVIASGKIYYGGLLRISDLNFLNTTEVLLWLDSNVATAVGIPYSQLVVRPVPGGYQLGLSRNSVFSGQMSWVSNTFTTSDTVAFVASFEFGATRNDDLSRLWINPDPLTFGTASEPAPTVSNSAGVDVPVQHVSLVFPMNSKLPRTVLFDEIRIATTWNEVTSTLGAPPPAVVTTTITDFQNRNYTGTIIESDEDTVRADPALNRETIEMLTTFRVENTNGAASANTLYLAYRLLDTNGIPFPILAVGQNVPNNTSSYVPSYFLDLPAGTSTNLTNIAKIRPAKQLDPLMPYRVELRLLRDNLLLAASTSDIPRTYLHFTNRTSVDPGLNVIGVLDSVTPVREFAIRSSTTGQQTFQVRVDFTIHRYDRFLAAAPGSNNLSVRFRYAIIDETTGLEMGLAGNSVSRVVSTPEWAPGGPGQIPSSTHFSQVIDILPFGFAPLDSVNRRYRFQVTLNYNNFPAQVFDQPGNTVTTESRQLLHFSGDLTGGDVNGRFGEIDNVPVNQGASDPGLLTTLSVVNNSGRIPGTRYTFGDGTDLLVRLLTNGIAELVSGSIPLTGGTNGSSTVGGFTVTPLTGLALGTNGLQGGIRLDFPSGLGIRTGSRAQPFSQGSIEFSEARFNTNGAIAGTATVTAPIGQKWYLHEESKPLWFETTQLTWLSQTGEISFTASKVEHVRTDLYAELQNQVNVAAGGAAGIAKPSNDRYWEFITENSRPLVTVGADRRGRATISFTAGIDGPGSFESHFPAGVTVGWSGSGTITVTNDLIVPASSPLSGLSNSVASYTVDCRDCGPILIGSLGSTQTATLAFNEAIKFTADGGLVGTGVPGGDRQIRWGKSGGVFTHAVSNISSGTLHVPGSFLAPPRDSAPGDLPGILMLTGIEARTGEPAARPRANGTNSDGDAVARGEAYEAGEGAYAGFNFQANGRPATGIVAGQSAAFSTSNREKIYTRRSGVSGIHESLSLVVLTNVYGYNLTVSNLSLSFLGGQNVESGVSGLLEVPFPAGFSYPLEGITLTCNGHFDELPVSRGGTVVELDYWDTPLHLNGISFQPVSGSTNPFFAAFDCSSTDRSLVFDVTVRAENTFLVTEGRANDSFSGRLAIGSDGNIQPRSAGVLGTDSRLSGPTSLSIKGLSEQNFRYEPVADAYFNTFNPNYLTSLNGAEVGCLNLVGTLDVALFEDLKAHLHVRPASALAPVYIMGGWPAAGFEDESEAVYWEKSGKHFFNDENFDADHQGKPANRTANTYRDQTTEDYNVRAQKLWAQIVKFDFPLTWSSSAREFNGLEAKEKNLLVLKTKSELAHLTGETADLTFGLHIGGSPIVGLTELLLDGTGLNTAMQEVVGVELTDLSKGLGDLNAMIDTDTHSFWDPVLDDALDPVVDLLYAALKAQYPTNDPCSFVSTVEPVLDLYFNGAIILGVGQPSVSNKLSALAGTYTDPASLVGQTYKRLGNVHLGLQAVLGMFAVVETVSKTNRPTMSNMAGKALDYAGLNADLSVADQIEEFIEQSNAPLDEITKVLKQIDASVLQLQNLLKPGQPYATYMAELVNGERGEIATIASRSMAETRTFLRSFDCRVDDPFADLPEAEFKEQLRQIIHDEVYRSGLPVAVQEYLRELVYDLNSQFVDGVNAALGELNRVLSKAMQEGTISAAGSASEFLGELAKVMSSAADLTGDAHVVGDSLQKLTLNLTLNLNLGTAPPSEEEVEPKEESSLLGLAATLTINNYDNDGDDGTCSYGSVPATEVKLDVSAQAANFLTDDFKIEAWILFAFTGDLSPGAYPPLKVLQAGGGFEVPVIIPILPPLIQLSEIGGAASFGLKENYLSANCDVNLAKIYTVTGGLFVGKTCSYDAFGDWAKDVDHLIRLGPDGWGGIYSECSANMGIGTNCMLSAHLSGGIGYGFSWSDSEVLGRVHGEVDGNLLCFINAGAGVELNVRGDLNDLLGGDIFGALWFNGCARVELQVLFTFEKEICITYQDGKFTGE